MYMMIGDLIETNLAYHQVHRSILDATKIVRFVLVMLGDVQHPFVLCRLMPWQRKIVTIYLQRHDAASIAHMCEEIPSGTVSTQIKHTHITMLRKLHCVHCRMRCSATRNSIRLDFSSTQREKQQIKHRQQLAITA